MEDEYQTLLISGCCEAEARGDFNESFAFCPTCHNACEFVEVEAE